MNIGVFETWNINGIERNDTTTLRIIKQIIGENIDSNLKKRTVGIFMYQEITKDNIDSLSTIPIKIHGQQIMLHVKWFRNNSNIYPKNAHDGEYEEITEYDYCVIYYGNRICGHFKRQKSWNFNYHGAQRGHPIRLSDFTDKKDGSTYDSYNGMVWSPEFKFVNMELLKYMANQKNGQKTPRLGYRTSNLITLSYKDMIFHTVSIHGLIGDKNMNLLNQLEHQLNDKAYKENNMNVILGGDYNMTPQILAQYNTNGIMNTFVHDNQKRFTHINLKRDSKNLQNWHEYKNTGIGYSFMDKLDWIFFRFSNQLRYVGSYTGDLDMVVDRKNKSDHVRVAVYFTL
ncbi:hypothetical protein BMW23_1094 [Bodo saltans virus]|uniref:Endonuclease/exonuclease/phosphatase domain-containing protein n=1 Tax=Bodo saltans virus TaxID=2024608 RepID=A0A2H4UW18_9VIRU|nr:hypothetical protein QJ851_gp1075 [Bodo saltans virus]ATZ81138.1 hypothetical protein BMW23_1094 [Bodo saltans virus]